MIAINSAAKHPEYDIRGTRAYDAKVKLGVLGLLFKNNVIKIELKEYIRESNKQLIVDIERVIHGYEHTAYTFSNIEAMVNEIIPIAEQIQYDY